MFERLSPRLVRFTDEKKRTLFDLADAPRPDTFSPASVRLLDGFETVMLGHAEKDRIIDPAHRPLIANKNLRVPTVFLVDGFVAGTWTTTVTRRSARLTLRPFDMLPGSARSALAVEGEGLLAFLSPQAAKREIAFA